MDALNAHEIKVLHHIYHVQRTGRMVFAAVLLGWMPSNTEILRKLSRAFDPYPFVFLNLMLSTVATIQAPIIMMSQNR